MKQDIEMKTCEKDNEKEKQIDFTFKKWQPLFSSVLPLTLEVLREQVYRAGSTATAFPCFLFIYTYLLALVIYGATLVQLLAQPHPKPVPGELSIPVAPEHRHAQVCTCILRYAGMNLIWGIFLIYDIQISPSDSVLRHWHHPTISLWLQHCLPSPILPRAFLSSKHLILSVEASPRPELILLCTGPHRQQDAGACLWTHPRGWVSIRNHSRVLLYWVTLLSHFPNTYVAAISNNIFFFQNIFSRGTLRKTAKTSPLGRNVQLLWLVGTKLPPFPSAASHAHQHYQISLALPHWPQFPHVG